MVRTVPDDGAERDLYVQRRRRPDGPELARVVNNGLREGLTPVLYSVMGEVEAHDLADLPAVGAGVPDRVRAGDRAGAVEALAPRAQREQVNADVAWAMAPVLVPSQAVERRSLVVVYPIVPLGRAQRQSETRQWGTDLGGGVAVGEALRGTGRKCGREPPPGTRPRGSHEDLWLFASAALNAGHFRRP